MVFNQIAYFPIFGIHLLVYLGIITLILLIITTIMGYLVLTGKSKFTKHKGFALAAIVFALIHGFLAIGATFIG